MSTGIVGGVVGSGINIKQIALGGGAFGPREVEQMTQALGEESTAHRQLSEAVQELESSEDRSPAAAVRLGLCYYLLGRYWNSVETLKSGDGGALALFYLARSHFALEQYEQAVEAYQAASKAGYESDVCSLAQAEALRSAGQAQRAL